MLWNCHCGTTMYEFSEKTWSCKWTTGKQRWGWIRSIKPHHWVDEQDTTLWLWYPLNCFSHDYKPSTCVVRECCELLKCIALIRNPPKFTVIIVCSHSPHSARQFDNNVYASASHSPFAIGCESRASKWSSTTSWTTSLDNLRLSSSEDKSQTTAVDYVSAACDVL